MTMKLYGFWRSLATYRVRVALALKGVEAEQQYINLLQYNQAATVLWMIVIVVTAMDYASATIRARLV